MRDAMLTLNLKKKNTALYRPFLIGLLLIVIMMLVVTIFFSERLEKTQSSKQENLIRPLPFFLMTLGEKLADEPDFYVREIVWQGGYLILSVEVSEEQSAYWTEFLSQMSSVQAVDELTYPKEGMVRIALNLATDLDQQCSFSQPDSPVVNILDEGLFAENRRLVFLGDYAALIQLLCEKINDPEIRIDYLSMKGDQENVRLELSTTPKEL